MRKDIDETGAKIMKVGKRIAITILCCVPFLIVVSYLLRNVLTSDTLWIIIYMITFGGAVLIEELISRSKEKRKKMRAELHEDEDVFK